MTKTIFSTVALLFLLQGCGGSSSNDGKKAPSGEVSKEVKSFAYAFKDGISIGSMVEKSSSSAEDTLTNSFKMSKSLESVKYEKESLQSCSNGGTKKVSTDVDFDNLTEELAFNLFRTGFSLSMDMNDCIEDGTKTDASMSMTVKVKNDLMSMDIKFNRNSTFEEIETGEIVTVYKDSNMSMEEISDYEELVTESIKATSSTGKSYESIALTTHEFSAESSNSFYEVSGKIVHKDVTYRVDENYDGSKTPMVIDDEGNVISGTAKYFNVKNEHITVKVIGKNKIKISVDGDNDGTDDAEETIDL